MVLCTAGGSGRAGFSGNSTAGDPVHLSTARYGTAGLPNAWKSTVAHEVGHALSLDDMDMNNQAEDWPVVPHSIMSYGRDRTVVIAPHNCDVAGVKKNYMS